VAISATQNQPLFIFWQNSALLRGKLNLTDVDLAFLIPHATDIGSLNFLTLPLAPLATAITTFPTFEALV